MDIAKSDALLPRSEQPPRGRVALGHFHALFDSQIQPQVVPFGSTGPSGGAVKHYFDQLLEQDGCEGAWKAYTRVDKGFPRQLANGTAPLNGFRHYMLQDAIYLEYYVRARMEAIASWDSKVSSKELSDFIATIPAALKCSNDAKYKCQTKLGIQEKDIDEKKSPKLEKSIRNYESVIANAITDKSKSSNSWLDIHFALLPCIKGYYTIAKTLLKDRTTLRNTLYYSLWIEENADGTYADEYDKFIQNNIGSPTSKQLEHWGNIFKQACNNELEFFNLAITDFPKYDIVSAGSYTIHPFNNETHFLDVAGVEVVVSDNHSGTKGRVWKLENSPDGYSIKLAGEQLLGLDGQKVVIQSKDSMKWSINPVFIPGNNTYQLFPKGYMQLALEADGNKVSVAKNDTTSQMWILSPSSA